MTTRPQSRQQHADEGQRIRIWPCTPASCAGKKHESEPRRFRESPDDSIGAKNALDELLAMAMPPFLTKSVVKSIGDGVLRGLSDELILKVLKSIDSQIRQTAALKAVASLQKARIHKVLAKYMNSSDSYYYDVVHLLDLGTLVGERSRSCCREAGLRAVRSI
jgi:hypothetical protein